MDKPLSHLFQDLGDVIGSILDHPDTTPEIKNALNALVCDLDNQAGNIKNAAAARARGILPSALNRLAYGEPERTAKAKAR